LLPLIYDPNSSLGEVAVASGITNLRAALLPLTTADFGRDTRVDAEDLAVWKTGFGTLSAAFRVQGDATGNGAIAGDDFLAWQRLYSDSFAPLHAASAVPEPTAIALMLTALACYKSLRPGAADR